MQSSAPPGVLRQSPLITSDKKVKTATVSDDPLTKLYTVFCESGRSLETAETELIVSTRDYAHTRWFAVCEIERVSRREIQKRWLRRWIDLCTVELKRRKAI